jgi:DNA-binding NarL/FixJ family response regulator
MVESLLEQRFKTLVVVAGQKNRRQLTTLLSIRWPAMIVVDVDSTEEGRELARALKPDLVLLDLGLSGVADLLRAVRDAGTRTRVIGMAPDDGGHAFRADPLYAGVDYFVPLGPAGHTDLAVVVHGLQHGDAHH